MTIGKEFLGKGWKFPVAVDANTGKILMSSYEDDIAEAIRIILGTAPGERVMRPGFGCGMRNFVFGSSDYSTLRLLESSIRDAIRAWEPRVDEVKVEAVMEDEERGKLRLNISYLVRNTNNLYNLVYPFYIREGTG